MKTSEEIQRAVNDLFFQKGEFCCLWPNYDELLAERGLTKSMVTEEVKKRAEVHIRQKLRAQLMQPATPCVEKSRPAPPQQPGERSITMSKAMHVSEPVARQILIDLGKKSFADMEVFPASRLAEFFNGETAQEIIAARLEEFDKNNSHYDTLLNIADSLGEGETIVIDTPVQDLQTPNPETAPMTAVLETPKKRGRKPKTEANGQVAPALEAPQHAAVGYKLTDKPRQVHLTSGLAKRFKEMTRYPQDRPLKADLCAHLRSEILGGRFNGARWVSAVCRETGATYRVNGKHTSCVFCDLYEAREEFPTDNFYITVEEYECQTLQDVAQLFSTFDYKGSSRSKNDILRGFAATEDALAGLKPKIVNLLTTGLAFSVWEQAYRRQPAAEQSLLLLQHMDWARWALAVILEDANHMQRMPVLAAMARTWHVDKEAAQQFWQDVKEGEAEAKSPARRLFKLLSTRKIGAVVNSAEAISNREAYLRCLLAWNAFRGHEDTFEASMATPAVL